MSLEVRVALMLLYRSWVVESLRLLWGEGMARGDEEGILMFEKFYG